MSGLSVETVGPYEVLSLVGVGGMGEVYKAYDSRLNRAVAIKMLPGSFADDNARLLRFEQEARTLAALNHPNIVAAFDVGTQNGKPYLVTEFLVGETLRALLQRGALRTRKAIAYAAEIAEALSAAHSKGIIHRDLKPENIFITTEGRVKVLDFGLARSMPSAISNESPTITGVVETDPGIVMGTVGYMSPEQVRGGKVDHRSDIFAFGSVLYEMISGKRAFHRSSGVETMNAILNEEPPEIVEHLEFPPALNRILQHCLEKEAERRFDSARDLAFDLAAISTASESARAGVVSAQRGGVLKLATFVGLVILVTAVALFFGLRLRHPFTPRFQKLTFQRGLIFASRFAPDRKTAFYSASWSGNPAEVYSASMSDQESRSLNIGNADLLAVSSQGELAVLLKPMPQMAGFLHVGTLGRVGMSGSTAPREIADSVDAADWSPDGQNLAVIRVDRQRNLDIVEYPLGKQIYQSTRPAWLSHVRISPDGLLIAFLEHYGVNDDRGRVLVIDTHGKSKSQTAIWDGIYGLAWISNTKLWVSATMPQNMARQLFEVDLSGDKHLVLEVPGELTLQDVTADGTALVTMNERRILVEQFKDGKWSDLSYLDRTLLDAISSDGSLLLFHEGGQGGHPQGTTYIRKLDGSAPVRLADGYGIDLSPDNKWVFVWLPTVPGQYRLVPTGAGEPKPVKTPDIRQPLPLGFSRDRRSLLWTGKSADDQLQVFATYLDGSNPRAVGPPGSVPVACSINGRYEIRGTADGFRLLDYHAESNQPLGKLSANDFVLSVSDDGLWVYFARLSTLPSLQVFHMNLQTGAAERIAEVNRHDLAGIGSFSRILITPDGKNIVLSYIRHTSELYRVQSQ